MHPTKQSCGSEWAEISKRDQILCIIIEKSSLEKIEDTISNAMLRYLEEHLKESLIQLWPFWLILWFVSNCNFYFMFLFKRTNVYCKNSSFTFWCLLRYELQELRTNIGWRFPSSCNVLEMSSLTSLFLSYAASIREMTSSKIKSTNVYALQSHFTEAERNNL